MCYSRNMPIATDFLDLNMQNIFHTAVRDMPPVIWKEMGGYDLAERKLILFIPYEDYPYQIPYDIIKITPSNVRFAEELSHRDYLGALLNLGIAREKLGDIIIDDGESYVFCINSITDYITGSLTKVKHTFIKTEVMQGLEFDYKPRFDEIKGSVASLRLDAVISLGFGGSRSHLISYIEDGRVAVNGRIITTNAYNIKPDDIISVRGLGKMQFVRTVSETRKGRIMVILHRYV